jgi:nitrogen-specific signal transduction histidine kinase
VQLKTDGPLAVIDIADSGPGPDPAVADKLFEPFVTGKRDGVGLGLAVARQVAEGHGGKVTFRREEGRTVFRVELPMSVCPT